MMIFHFLTTNKLMICVTQWNMPLPPVGVSLFVIGQVFDRLLLAFYKNCLLDLTTHRLDVESALSPTYQEHYEEIDLTAFLKAMCRHLSVDRSNTYVTQEGDPPTRDLACFLSRLKVCWAGCFVRTDRSSYSLVFKRQISWNHQQKLPSRIARFGLFLLLHRRRPKSTEPNFTGVGRPSSNK